jgi:hypothetical protein
MIFKCLSDVVIEKPTSGQPLLGTRDSASDGGPKNLGIE